MSYRVRKSRLFGAVAIVIMVLSLAGFATYVSFKDVIPPFTSQSASITNKGDRLQKSVSELDITNELMLVNTDTALKDDNIPGIVDAFGVVPLSVKDIQLNENALKQVKEMFRVAVEDGHGKFFVNSGFRTNKKQASLYNKAQDKSFVQKPGASEHQTGYAVDIAYAGLTNEMFEQSEQFDWLKKNAWKYGFILRYPKTKVDVTKISYEPWHYRYVGTPHAYYCYKNNLCLEEYMDFLLKTREYSVKIGEDEYTVYYTEPQDGNIEVPAKGEYNVSRNNKGGYIVTVKG